MPEISFNEALAMTVGSILPLPAEDVPIGKLTGRVTASLVASLIDTPSVDISLKDGYAVISSDIAGASPACPVQLRLTGSRMAGSSEIIRVVPGTTVRIMSGAAIPDGADAVVAEEFTACDNGTVSVSAPSARGRNILEKGTDAAIGDLLVEKGSRLSPSQIGLLAAAGHEKIPVYRSPRVGIVATGDEVVAVGRKIRDGMVFASNLVTIASWCSIYGMSSKQRVVNDSATAIRRAISDVLRTADCLITSGGAWKGERDRVVQILDDMGWEKTFHRVRMGPGKAIGFGHLASKPVFCLPGGPPSNQMAFLQLALPGLLKLGGHTICGLPVAHAIITEAVQGQKDWTQFIYGSLRQTRDGLEFRPLKLSSRLQFMARADAIVMIAEGCEKLEKGSRVPVQLVSRC